MPNSCISENATEQEHADLISVGANEDHWKTQEHNQFDCSLHSRRLVDGENMSCLTDANRL